MKRHANFKSATNAMILLMRIVTGEDWNKIMVAFEIILFKKACSDEQKNFIKSFFFILKA